MKNKQTSSTWGREAEVEKHQINLHLAKKFISHFDIVLFVITICSKDKHM